MPDDTHLEDMIRFNEAIGLGLFIVRQIARAHGGDVTMRSDKEETVFGVQLPLRK